MEDYDNKFYENLKWMLENDASVLMRTFSETIDFFGQEKIIDLIPNGRSKDVDNDNKQDYILKVSFFKLYEGVKKQIDAFLRGFYEIIPKKFISIFDHHEIELLISGLPEIDIDDLKANTEYKGYEATS